MTRPDLHEMVKKFLTIHPQTIISIEDMIFQVANFTVQPPVPGDVAQQYVLGSLAMIQPKRETEFIGYARWPISRKAEQQAQQAEELYCRIDWNHPSDFWWETWDSIKFTTENPPKQLKIGDEVWNVEQPPKLYDRNPEEYTYEAVLYRYSTDRQTIQFGKAVWAVSLFDADAYRNPNVFIPPRHNRDYFPFTYWELPEKLQVWIVTENDTADETNTHAA